MSLLALLEMACEWLGVPMFAIGFSVGFAIYAVTHYWLHHGQADCWLTRKLRRNHNVHHHIDDHSNYGVTSPLWDIVFRTYKTRK